MIASSDIPKLALLTAVTSSVGVTLLLVAASSGVWMEGANLHPTPRINAFTVGLGAVPIPVLAWIVYLWTRSRLRGSADIVLRILISLALIVGSGLAVLMALFAALFVG